jgi:hypothetical protein
MSCRFDGGTARIRDRRPAIDPVSLAKFRGAEIAALARVAIPNAGRPDLRRRFL